MEARYQSNLGSLETYVDDAAFRLLSLELPRWYINPDIKVVFLDRAAWDSVVDSSPLSFAPGVDQVLSSTEPPSINFFRTLPTPSKTRKQWGIYALVLERPGCTPILYIGSGRNAEGRIQARHTSYINLTGPFAYLVQKALDGGFTITSCGMLCWTDLPAPHLVPRLRARVLVLEAVFTIVFYACIKTIMDDVFIPDFFLWQRQDVDWEPGCTHLSLSESVKADLKLTDEELTLAAAARTQRSTEKTARCRQRQRDVDEAAFLQKGLDQHRAWSASNPGRVNEIAAGTRQRAKDSARFRCNTCDINLASQWAYDEHVKSRRHIKAAECDGKDNKPPSDASTASRRRRAEAVANKTHYCSTCKKAFTTAATLRSHNTRARHLNAVDKARKAPKLTA